jgi:hypothetical protein
MRPPRERFVLEGMSESHNDEYYSVEISVFWERKVLARK